MAKKRTKSAKGSQDDTVLYSVNSSLIAKDKSETSTSKEAAIEYLNKIAKQLPKDPK